MLGCVVAEPASAQQYVGTSGVVSTSGYTGDPFATNQSGGSWIPETLSPGNLVPGELISAGWLSDSSSGLSAASGFPAGTPGGFTSGQPAFLPLETLYPSYLAGPQEPRLGTQWVSEANDGTLWDTTLGGRFGWLRGTSRDGRRLWQIDIEGAAMLRLDPNENVDLRGVDFRAGIPLAIAWGQHRLKLAYYHLSAHVGDEYLLKNPTFQRLNYVRDALVLGYARYFGERVRVYGEASWAFYADISDPWQFQVGFESVPMRPTGIRGAPFIAINGLLREELGFGGTTTLHAGWAWRGSRAGRLLRTGLFLQTGKTHLLEFYDQSETMIGAGLWYDF